MIRFASRLATRLALADRRLDARMRRRGSGEDGFVLLETLVAISLTSVVMAAFTTFFVNSVANTSHQRATQAATQAADSAVDLLRSLPASDLVAGHDSTSVGTQFNAASATVTPWLQDMARAVDSTAAVNAGRTATIPTVAVTQTLNNVVYSVNSYLGTCVVATGALLDASCVAPPGRGTGYLRAVVAVTWAGTYCPPTLCSYVTSTLLSADSDPTFNLNQTPPSIPRVTVPDQVSTVGETVNLQLALNPNTGVPPTTWALTAGVLPAGLSMTRNGLISGVPTAVTPATSLTVTATDGLARTASATFSWTVVAKPTITTPPDQTTTINTAVSLAVAATCPNAPCTYTLTNGPVGLSIDNTGLITGKPTVAGTVSVTVTVTDRHGVSATSNSFTWAVLSPATVCVPSLALPNGSFEAPPVSPGAPNWLVGGSLPLRWDTTEADNVVELWGNGGNVQSANGGIPIAAQDGTTWAELNANDVGALYQDVTTVAGQVMQWSVWHRARGIGGGNTTGQDVMQVQIGTSRSTSPQVPTGQTTPAISDGPQAWVRYTGLYTVPAGQTTTRFQFAAVSTASGDRSIGNFIDNLSLNNNIACLTTAVVDRTSTQNTAIAPVKISVDRGTGPFVWGGGATLPAGLAISSDGTITGTPTSVGTSAVTLTFSDATSFTQSVSFTWTVVAKPSVTAPAGQTHSVGASVNLPLTTSCPDSPCTYVLNNGPSGLTVNGAGVVTGTVTGAPQGFNAVTVTVTDAAGAATTSANFTWTVLAAPTVTTPAAQSATVGSAVSLTVAATCPNTPCTYALANAPSGLTINNSGVITGSPTSPGTTSAVTVTVTDNSGVSATTAGFSWTVLNAPTITTPATQTMTVGTSVSLATTYTCPNAPCTFTLANAPPGLTVTNRGVITGSPTSVGTSNAVTVTVRDNAAVAATTASFTINVIAPPSAPTSPAATAGNAQIAVSWQAPATTNGSAVTGYTATSAPGGATCTPSPATATGCTITGLQNATTYTVTITATNAAGTGPPSTPVSATPVAPPTCTSVAVAANAYLAYPLNDASGLVAADVSGNARAGTYTSSGITYGAPGPCPRDGGKAVTLNGTTGYISSNVAPANPQIFSVAIWFKTTVAGGKLIGLGQTKTGASSQYDRHLYLTTAGRVTFGVYPGGPKVITSPLSYNDGKWHQAIASLAPSTDANPGMRLYVDGKLVVADATTTTAEAVGGPSYWRVGYDNLNGWPDQPTNSFFTGSLAFAATYTTALTPAQALAQYNAGT